MRRVKQLTARQLWVLTKAVLALVVDSHIVLALNTGVINLQTATGCIHLFLLGLLTLGAALIIVRMTLLMLLLIVIAWCTHRIIMAKAGRVDVEKLLELSRQGLTQRAMAAELGVSQPAVSQAL